MTSATLFTLLAVPVFFTIIEDGKNGFTNILASVFDRSAKAGPNRESTRIEEDARQHYFAGTSFRMLSGLLRTT